MCRPNLRHEFHMPKEEALPIAIRVRKYLIRELQLKEYSVDTNSSSVSMSGKGLLVIFGRPTCFATSAYRQILPGFPLIRFAKATERCTTGSQSTHVVHA
jgi:hypothetical protein